MSFQTSITMAKASWEVLKKDKELMAIPVIGAAVSLVVGLILLVPFLTIVSTTSEVNDVTGETELSLPGSLGALALFLVGYFSLVLITQTFAGAVVHGAHTRMTGGDPTIASSLKGAFSKIRQLLPWALATGTVGIILDKLREMGFIGKIIAGFLNFAWKTATFIVIPILVIEGLGPKAAYQRSRQLMQGRYGDSATATFGFGIAGFVGSLVGMGLIGLGVVIGGVGYVLAVLGVIWLIVVAVVITTLTGVFRTALYLYAVNGQVPGEFQSTQMERAFA